MNTRSIFNSKSTSIKSTKPPPFATVAQNVLAKLQGLDNRHIGGLIAQGFDLALRLDKLGKIEQIIHMSQDLETSAAARVIEQLTGKSLLDVVTSESRPKIVDLLRTAVLDGGSRWRQINLILRDDSDWALSAAAMKIDRKSVV